VRPLQWDAALAAAAVKAAATCNAVHARPAGTGEAMARGFKDFKSAVDAWYKGIEQYDFSKPGLQTGAMLFAQVVWASTTKVGCAVSDTCARPFYVCLYSPARGYTGWDKNVRPPTVAVTLAPPLPPTLELAAGIKVINAQRAKHGAAPLAWDASLAAGAAAWATTCPAEVSGEQGVGESVAKGSSDLADVVAKEWYSEVSVVA